MGFWSTVLIALRFRADRVPVITAPLHSHRIWLDAVLVDRVRAETVMAHKIRNDFERVHRVHLEAR